MKGSIGKVGNNQENAVVAEIISSETIPPQIIHEERQTDEGGIFLILLFYYFQDAAIVHFYPIYAEATDPLIALVKQFLGGLFKFQLDILLFAGNICPLPWFRSSV